MLHSRLAPSNRHHERYLEPSEKLEYETLVLASKGYLLLLRSLLLRARTHLHHAALEARIRDLPIDTDGEALIRDIDTALSQEHAHVTARS